MFDASQIQIDIVDSTEKAFECLRWASDVRTPIVAVDIESDGLDWFDGKLRLVQFGTLTEGWAIPFELFHNLVDEILDVFERRQMPLVGHNFKFDLHWLDRHTKWTPTHWGRYHDTLQLAGVIDSSGSKALKDLSVQFVSPIAKQGQTRLAQAMKAGGWTWGTVPVFLEDYWVYGVLDTILTANLFAILMPKSVNTGTHAAYEVERGCVPALYAMERRGMLVDAEHCNTQIRELTSRMLGIETSVREQYGIENIGSSDQLIRAFLDAGVELTTRTESQKKFSMSREAFEELEARQGSHPLVAEISTYRKAQKYVGSYYENFLKFQKTDGRVHPMYNQSQARTGRMSANFPAIQTIPRPDSDVNVRNSFVAQEGHYLISTDFTNVEARIFAHFAQEQGMLEAIRANIDLHGYTAQQVYHQWETVAPKDHPLRQVAKNTLFCVPLSTKALTRNGIKAHNEISLGDEVLGYKNGSLVWTKVTHVHHPGKQEVVTFGNKHRQFMATKDHRWVGRKRTDHGSDGRSYDHCMFTTDEFVRGGSDHNLLLSAPLFSEDRSGLSPLQASLLGWMITDGHIRWSDCTSRLTSQSGGSKRGVSGFLTQMKPNTRKIIENKLSVFIRHSTPTGYDIHPSNLRDLFIVSGLNHDYSNLYQVVLSMGTEQVTEFWEACWLAEGSENGNRISQNPGPKYDAIRLACYLTGHFPGVSRPVLDGHSCRSFAIGKPTMTSARVGYGEHQTEEVWCITTETGNWVSVDVEQYALTGNCMLFGGGPGKVATTAKVDLETAKDAFNGIHRAFPGIKRFQKKIEAMAVENLEDTGRAWIRGVDGRILAMKEGDDRYYAFTNWLIQGTATVLLKQRLAVIHNMGLSEYCVAAIHDEVVAEVPDDFVEDFTIQMTEAMLDEVQFSVPIVADPGKPARRLGDAK